MKKKSNYKLEIFLFTLALLCLVGIFYFTSTKASYNEKIQVNEKITHIINECDKSDLINDYGEDADIIIYEAGTNEVKESGYIEETQKNRK